MQLHSACIHQVSAHVLSWALKKWRKIGILSPYWLKSVLTDLMGTKPFNQVPDWQDPDRFESRPIQNEFVLARFTSVTNDAWSLNWCTIWYLLISDVIKYLMLTSDVDTCAYTRGNRACLLTHIRDHVTSTEWFFCNSKPGSFFQSGRRFFHCELIDGKIIILTKNCGIVEYLTSIYFDKVTEPSFIRQCNSERAVKFCPGVQIVCRITWVAW